MGHPNFRGWRMTLYTCGFREGFLETNISELRYEEWFEIRISWVRSQKLHRDALSRHSCIFLKNIYLFGCLCSHLLHAGSLSYYMWNLVPWPGIEPRPPALGVWRHSLWITREVPAQLHLDLPLSSALWLDYAEAFSLWNYDFYALSFNRKYHHF